MNMSFLFVTLDMSKLSSWLNAVAYCRVERRPHATREECGPGGVKALGGGNASGMHGKGPTQAAGARARAERTENIQLMSVTLDVSKLSGWLKASAYCRVKTRARNVGGTRYGPGGVRALCVAATQSACTGRARLKTGVQGTRGAHEEHLVHGRDLGRVEAERLVEGIRALPSRNAGMQCGTRYGPGGVRALGVVWR